MKNKIIESISFALLVILFFSSCKYIGAGSFSNAQYYTLDVTEEELIDYIQEFMIEYPEYKLMELQSDGSFKEKKNYYQPNFYIAYFYIPAHNIVMHCLTSKDTNGLGQIGLFAVRRINLDLKKINTSDFTKKENKQYKKLFEDEVLTPLKEFIAK